jgi:hypothetical protein
VTSGVATDVDGNVYIAGYTDGSLGRPNLGDYDAWLAKYSAHGALRWNRQLGTAKGDITFGVATDGDGNVYIAGSTSGSLAGPNQGVHDAWVAKYSTNGALGWKRQLGTAVLDGASGVATDGAGNVYIGGHTFGSLGGPQRGNSDAWVAKYSATGDLLWNRQIGSAAADLVLGVATDGVGSVYIAGYTDGSLGGPNKSADPTKETATLGSPSFPRGVHCNGKNNAERPTSTRPGPLRPMTTTTST